VTGVIKKEIVATGPKRKGKKELLFHLEGGKLTRRQAIAAFCYDCQGFYTDGKPADCKDASCPLHPFMPYATREAKAAQ
jgi:hypothetical protein